ncbi:hypothetical protein, partial [Neisseria musculi]|uniref:hypothetical protein n=2 Tax=Neisseria TaxID=482 RepID=UPI003610D5D4
AFRAGIQTVKVPPQTGTGRLKHIFRRPLFALKCSLFALYDLYYKAIFGGRLSACSFVPFFLP